MLYWLLIGAGLILVVCGFILMISTQRKEQRAWSRLLREERERAEDAFHELHRITFRKPLRLSLTLMLAGMALGVAGIILK